MVLSTKSHTENRAHDLGNVLVRCSRDGDLDWLRSLVQHPFYLAEEESFIWVRTAAHESAAKSAAACLPGDHFELIDDELLVRPGEQVACMRLPKLQWYSAQSCIHPGLPTIISAGRLRVETKLQWQLVRGGSEMVSDAALIDWKLLTSWVETAAQSRLDRLRFCVRREVFDGFDPTIVERSTMALVVGSPLPPIACRYLCRYERLIVPAGYTWQPHFPPSYVLRSFQVEEQCWLLWLPESVEHIPCDLLQPLRRSNVRELDAMWNRNGKD